MSRDAKYWDVCICKASFFLSDAKYQDVCICEAVILFSLSPASPIWIQPLQATTVPQGQNAVFHCEARSAASENPPNPPRWMKNGQRLDQVYGQLLDMFSPFSQTSIIFD